MLTVDLALLERERRVSIDADVPPDDTLWNTLEAQLDGPVRIRLEAQQAGDDVIVRGRVAGTVALRCRRCLEPVRVAFEEPVTLVYRSGVDAVEAESEEVYVLPTRARVLELGPALQEHVNLAVPGYAVCREACRGLCPQCGVNRNETDCACGAAGGDERWAVLRGLHRD